MKGFYSIFKFKCLQIVLLGDKAKHQAARGSSHNTLKLKKTKPFSPRGGKGLKACFLCLKFPLFRLARLQIQASGPLCLVFLEGRRSKERLNHCVFLASVHFEMILNVS